MKPSYEMLPEVPMIIDDPSRRNIGTEAARTRGQALNLGQKQS